MVINPAYLAYALLSLVSPKCATNGVVVDFKEGADTKRVQPGDLDRVCHAVPPVHMPVRFLQKLQQK